VQRGEVSEVRGGLLWSKQLDTTGRVLNYSKGQTTLKAPQHKPASHRYVSPTLLAGVQTFVVV
jgi:hypothetical protein